jgi:hypothetical protein
MPVWQREKYLPKEIHECGRKRNDESIIQHNIILRLYISTSV